jgi:SNF2 family DNA or RNA helicase
MKAKEWVAVNGFEGYEVHPELGIRNAKTGKILKGRTWMGYPKVTLVKDNKKHERRVHRLVGEHFLENPNNLPILNHKNSDRLDYRVSNLEWVDNSGNQLHRWKTHKDGVKKKLYRREYGPKNGVTLVKEAEVSLQPHQKRAVAKINREGRQLVYHGLGSGKTITSLKAKKGDTVVVTPASVRTHFKDVAEWAGIPMDNTKIYSYEGALKNKPKGDTLIIDEAHRIGRYDSKRSAEIRKLSKGYDRVIMLTGSPIRNAPHEIGPLADVLGIPNTKVPSSESAFKDNFIEEKHEKRSISDFLTGVKPGVTYSLKNKDVLRDAFAGKVDFYEPSRKNYPGVLEKHEKVTMSDDQMKAYRVLVSKTDHSVVHKISEGRPMTYEERDKANAFLTAARMISNTAYPFGGKRFSPKVNKIVSNISKNKGENHVVYSNYLDGGIRPIADKLSKKGVPYAMFYGGMSDKQKKLAIKDFNEGKINTLLLSSSGAEGVDLKGARNVHIVEPHWNQARTDQVVGRAVRFGSHKHLPPKDRFVTVHRYTTEMPDNGAVTKFFTGRKKDVSADEYIYQLSKTKQKLNDELLGVLKDVGTPTKKHKKKTSVVSAP